MTDGFFISSSSRNVRDGWRSASIINRVSQLESFDGRQWTRTKNVLYNLQHGCEQSETSFPCDGRDFTREKRLETNEYVSTIRVENVTLCVAISTWTGNAFLNYAIVNHGKSGLPRKNWVQVLFYFLIRCRSAAFKNLFSFTEWKFWF